MIGGWEGMKGGGWGVVRGLGCVRASRGGWAGMAGGSPRILGD